MMAAIANTDAFDVSGAVHAATNHWYLPRVVCEHVLSYEELNGTAWGRSPFFWEGDRATYSGQSGFIVASHFESLLRPTAEIDKMESTPQFSGMGDYAQCRSEIYTYPGLPDDWDGYGAPPPPAMAAYDAAEFLIHLQALPWLPAPVPAPAADQILLYWRVPGLHAEFGFEGDGLFYFYGRCDSSQPRLKMNDLAIDDGLPQEILNFLLVNMDALTAANV